jgi:hypothetical protein
MKKITGDKSTGVITHIYMEISQVNSICSYLYWKQAEMSFFILSFSFCFYKIGAQEDKTSTAQGVGWQQWERGDCEKGDRRVNMVPKMCMCVCKCENDTC